LNNLVIEFVGLLDLSGYNVSKVKSNLKDHDGAGLFSHITPMPIKESPEKQHLHR
jgi:hypothetical protein